MVFLGLAILFVAGCAADVDGELPGQDLPDLPEEPTDPQPVNEETDENSEQEETDENSEQETEETQASEPSVDRVIEVESVGLTFNPEVIEVEVGETIEFVYTNTGGNHDFVIPELGVGTDRIGGGQQDSFVYTFEEAGTFDFECSVGNHAAQGMVGELIVS